VDILVDAGPHKASDVVLGQLAGIPDLDVLLWTHAHEDPIDQAPSQPIWDEATRCALWVRLPAASSKEV